MLPAAFRPHLAVLLLLCLVRTLLPEAWVLALHDHEHTTEEPILLRAAGPGASARRQALLTPKHTHCHTEQFYDVPFQVPPPVVVPLPQVQLRYGTLAVPPVLANSATELRRTALRGPPAARRARTGNYQLPG